jgi:uncharacterized protein (DUF58 family)
MLHIAKFYSSFYLHKRSYLLGSVGVALFALSYFIPLLFIMAQVFIVCIVIFILFDIFLLYHKNNALQVTRVCVDRFSNGDDNKVILQFSNQYNFEVKGFVIDELPPQFQLRNWRRTFSLLSNAQHQIIYTLRPTQRGVYEFGNIIVVVASPFQFIQKRLVFHQSKKVAVYPSFLQLKKFSIHAITNTPTDIGVKPIRKLGSSTAFEQIKEYVSGDDFRKINWKATARKTNLMVNTFTDEKSQQIYCLIDKSRNMQMPFNGLTLLDHAINSAVIIANVALQKQDKAGLIAFAESIDTHVVADKKNTQMQQILDSLYQQKTNFLDPNYEMLYAQVRNKIKQRSLLMVYTNFESLYGLQRQLPYLKKIAHYHVLVVVIFENTAIKELTQKTATHTEEIYLQIIADKFLYEKKQMIKELQQNGIIAVLTTPQQLTINTLNKYLEIKSKQLI